MTDIHRRVVRAPVNPLDKSTVVSIYPVDLDERKPTISPGDFKLKAGSFEKPSTLVVGSSSWWREIDENQPLLEIPVSSVQVADSIVKDYCNGLFMCDMDGSMPGIFFVPGEWDLIRLVTEKKALLETARRKQNNFWDQLITIADSLWSRTNGNPLAISDLMRLGARERGKVDKPWMSNFIPSVSLENCPACGSLINKQFPVCSVCKTIINMDMFNKLGLKLAQ